MLGALDAGDCAPFSSIFLASSFSCSPAESTPAPAPVTHTVEAGAFVCQFPVLPLTPAIEQFYGHTFKFTLYVKLNLKPLG